MVQTSNKSKCNLTKTLSLEMNLVCAIYGTTSIAVPPMDPLAYSGWKSKTKLLPKKGRREKEMLSPGLWVDLLGKPPFLSIFSSVHNMAALSSSSDEGFQKANFHFLLDC